MLWDTTKHWGWINQLHEAAWTCNRIYKHDTEQGEPIRILITWLHICTAKSSKTEHWVFTCSYTETKILKKIKWNITKSKTGQGGRLGVLKSTSTTSVISLGNGFSSILIVLNCSRSIYSFTSMVYFTVKNSAKKVNSLLQK